MLNPSSEVDDARPLSHREMEVLKMTALGMTNDEIARRLDVTIHAVKFHLASVYRKLGVTNRTQATSVYLRASPTPTALPPEQPAP